MARKPTKKAPAKKPAGALPRKPKTKAAPSVKAAADRAEARAKGKPIPTPKVPIHPPIVKAAEIAKKPKLGRPPMPFDQEIADEFCEHITAGGSLRAYTLREDRPGYSTLYKWMREYPIFAEQYARAREDQAETFADAMAYIADTEEDVQRARLKIDTMKWVASKLKPKKYGDFKAIELTGADGGPVQIEETGELDQARRVALALGRALERQRMKVIDGATG